MSSEQVRHWYEQHASSYEHSATIQPNDLFGKLNQEQQDRLNRFKMWFLQEQGFVALGGKDILEFGCGHGRMAIETHGYSSYVGVDFVKQFVTFGQSRIRELGLSDRAKLVHADCIDFEADEGSFDIVCAFGMFEFVDDPAAILRKMFYHLRFGGTLFIDAHSSSPLYNLVRRSLNRRNLAAGGIPKQLHSVTEMCTLFGAVGLVNIRVWMAEFPFLSTLYARTGWRWIMALRNVIAERSAFRFLGTDFNIIAMRPSG